MVSAMAAIGHFSNGQKADADSMTGCVGNNSRLVATTGREQVQQGAPETGCPIYSMTSSAWPIHTLRTAIKIMPKMSQKTVTGPSIRLHIAKVPPLPAIKTCANTDGVINPEDRKHHSSCCSGVISVA